MWQNIISFGHLNWTFHNFLVNAEILFTSNYQIYFLVGPFWTLYECCVLLFSREAAMFLLATLWWCWWSLYLLVDIYELSLSLKKVHLKPTNCSRTWVGRQQPSLLDWLTFPLWWAMIPIILTTVFSIILMTSVLVVLFPLVNDLIFFI